MTIQDNFLTINKYSRAGTPLRIVKAVVMHWTGNPAVDAVANRNFFEYRKNGENGYGSAHYIIGLKGDVIRCIPESEVAYHCGSSQKDPKSGKIYTDLARKHFGEYAANPNLSPNLCTIGIEMCPLTDKGDFSTLTLESAAELTVDILFRHTLTADDILTHNEVVGWKDCPRLWVKRPMCFTIFKDEVRRRLSERLLGGEV